MRRKKLVPEVYGLVLQIVILILCCNNAIMGFAYEQPAWLTYGWVVLAGIWSILIPYRAYRIHRQASK